MVALVNLGSETFQVTRGMRIAQMIVARVERVVFRPVAALPSSARGTGGFGSSGT
jgi:dUTP pyrophosphatase